MRGIREMHARFLVQKSEGKCPFGRPRRRWEDNMNMNLKYVMGLCGLD